jgi:hypothetical protein
MFRPTVEARESYPLAAVGESADEVGTGAPFGGLIGQDSMSACLALIDALYEIS